MTGAVTGFSIGFLLDCLLIAAARRRSLVLLAPATWPGSSASASRSAAAWSRRFCAGLTFVRRARLRRCRSDVGSTPTSASWSSATCWSRASSPSSSAGRSTLGLRRLLRPALVEEATVRRPRRSTVLGAVGDAMYLRSDDRAAAEPMALRIAWSAALRGPLRDPLLPPLDPADPRRLGKPRRGEEQPHPLEQNHRPAGQILDRNGAVLVDNRTSLALQVDPTKLPEDPAEAAAELTELGELVHMSLPLVRKRIARRREDRRRRVADHAAPRRRLRPRSTTSKKTRANFPGVTVEQVFVRNYPEGAAPPTCSATSARSAKKS